MQTHTGVIEAASPHLGTLEQLSVFKQGKMGVSVPWGTAQARDRISCDVQSMVCGHIEEERRSMPGTRGALTM